MICIPRRQRIEVDSAIDYDFESDALGVLANLLPMLAKSLQDTHRYALQLRSVAIFIFDRAQLCDTDDWITLREVKAINMPELDNEFTFHRGVDVCVGHILWAADYGH